MSFHRPGSPAMAYYAQGGAHYVQQPDSQNVHTPHPPARQEAGFRLKNTANLLASARSAAIVTKTTITGTLSSAAAAAGDGLQRCIAEAAAGSAAASADTLWPATTAQCSSSHNLLPRHGGARRRRALARLRRAPTGSDQSHGVKEGSVLKPSRGEY